MGVANSMVLQSQLSRIELSSVLPRLPTYRSGVSSVPGSDRGQPSAEGLSIGLTQMEEQLAGCLPVHVSQCLILSRHSSAYELSIV